MIISKTPYRISFFGGGTDYAEYSRHNPGHVISTTIDRFVYLTCRNLPPFFKHNIRLAYSKIEEVNSPKQLHHNSVKSILKFLNLYKNLEIHYDGDLPARSGMGSSSAFTVGLLNSLAQLTGRKFSKYDLAKNAIDIEQNLSNELVGSQDQISASYGGFNYIKFKRNNFTVKKMDMNEKYKNLLDKNLLLFFTGITRTASKIAQTYIRKIENENLKNLKHIYEITNEGRLLLKRNKIDDFGKLLHDGWMYKKSLSKLISNSKIDNIYDTALKNGALGGKLLGAGGGGFLLLYVPYKKQRSVKSALKKLIHVPFNFSNKGSEIIFKTKNF